MTFDVNQTIISQYANSPTLVRLINDFAGYINPSADIQNFYDFVFNVDTAQGFGLDIWGRIVNVSRRLNVPAYPPYWGFAQSGNAQSFGFGSFAAGELPTTVFTLSDDAYRRLIMFKAALNISDMSIPAINQMLRYLFEGRGRCYVVDQGNMQMALQFEFPIEPYELAILTDENLSPRPAGVLLTVDATNNPVWGFKQSGNAQSFGQGAFRN